jgi:hypothetical protein
MKREKSYYMTQKMMREAKWYEAVHNSMVKRGDGVVRKYPLFQCGCGCGVA